MFLRTHEELVDVITIYLSYPFWFKLIIDKVRIY